MIEDDVSRVCSTRDGVAEGHTILTGKALKLCSKLGTDSLLVYHVPTIKVREVHTVVLVINTGNDCEVKTTYKLIRMCII
jgi:hypothetical protein